MIKLSCLIPVLLGTLSLLGCTANATKETVCKRTCGGRVIGGGKLRGLAISPAITYKNCSPLGSDLPQQTYHFFIYDDTSGTTTTTTSGSAPASVPPRVPAAGIAFTPIVPGYGNVDTDSADWCTDSCGIAEIKFTPVCAEQDVSVGVLVPGMVFDGGATEIPSTKFTVEIE